MESVHNFRENDVLILNLMVATCVESWDRAVFTTVRHQQFINFWQMRSPPAGPMGDGNIV